MAAARQTRRTAPEPRARQAFFGATVSQDLTIPLLQGPRRGLQDVPTDLGQTFDAVRRLSTPGPTGPANAFILTILELRLSFYDFSFEFTGKLEKEQRQQWFQSYRLDAWAEWLRMDNVICLWRKGGRPLRVPPERCRYRDDFGIETLEYEHRLSGEQIDHLTSLTPAQRAMLKSNSWLKLHKADDSIFGFEVLKRGALGEGLAWPTMQTALLAGSTQESLQVGDAQLAAAMRRIYEQHKCGHETRYGVNAGTNKNFLSEPMKQAVEKGIKGKKGLVELVTRHDHEIIQAAGRPDPKHFALTRYEASKAQLIDWSTPFGHMLFAKTLNPYLLLFLRQMALKERERMALHLEAVAARALNGPLKVKWGHKCFNDARLAFDMIKFGLASGPLSQETYLQDTDQQAATERARKAAEAGLPEEQTHPLVVAQGAAVTDRAGRKPGSNDRKEK